MKQTFIAWMCIVAMACAGVNPHTADRTDNALIGAQHQVALEKCLNDAVATLQTTQDQDKADTEYTACANAADVKYGRKP